MTTLDEALMEADDEWLGTECERVLAAEVRRLREENERLRAVLDSACAKMKQCHYVEARSDMLQAINTARSAKTEPAP